jgi:Secretion system C-terminal sorting domain
MITTVLNRLKIVFCLVLLSCSFKGFSKDPVTPVKAVATSPCGCDITLSPDPVSGQVYLSGQTLGVKPGNKVCLKSGHYVSIYLYNFFGTKAQPVTIVNCGGPVTVSGYSSYGFTIHNSLYVHITGTGDPATQRGIIIDGSVASTAYGFGQDDHVSDIEVDHLEVFKTGVGIGCAPTPTCDSTSWSTSWKMYNMSFHDNYVHETVGEGFYIGNTVAYYTFNCSGTTVTVQPQQIDSVKFYNNVIDKSGYTSAQISQVTGGVDIHDNVVTNYGYSNTQEHQAGIIVGGISRGRVYNNRISNGTGAAFQFFGAGLTEVYNNLFVNNGYDGSVQGLAAVLVDDRPKPPGFPGLKLYFVNNTIVTPKRNGISFYNDYGTVDVGNIIADNIIAAPGLFATYPTYSYADLQANPHATLYNNLFVPTLDVVKFADPANNNFHLLSNSPAVDSGMNTSPYGVVNDIEGTPRPYGTAYDIGAYEFHSANLPPTVSAGTAQTITLPVSTVTLTGTATGNNGATISSVAWTKVSGGAATITTATNLSTTVTGLVAGAYVFKLTATDKNGLTNSASVNITVNAVVVKTAPTVAAGPSQTVVLGSSSSSPPAATTPTSAYFNFSNAATTVSGWTNIHGSPGTAVVTASSNGITLSSVATANWAPYNGLTSYDDNGVNAAGFFNNAAVSVNNWFQYGDPAGNYNVSKPQLQVTGLAAGTTYTVKLSGSDNLGFQTNPVQFTIVGSASYTPVDVNMNGTANNGATFSSVSPDATGKINIYINTVPGLSSAAEIDGLQIIPNASTAKAAQVVQVSSPTSTTVTLTGAATGNNGATIVSTTWSETSGTAATITSPSALSTTVTGLAVGVYVFQLKATDNNGMSSSSTVTITVSNSTTSTAKSIQVNIYGGVNPYNNAAWNNWNVTSATAGPATSPAFTYTDGTTSPVTATMSVDQGVADNGTSYGGTIADPQVLRYASYNSYRRTLTLNNIPAGSLVSLEIYGSRANTGNTSIYTINGVGKSLVTDYNLTQSVIFSNLTVTNGQVQVTIDKVSSFNYINGFRLSYTPSGTSVTGGVIQTMSTAEVTPELLTDMTDKLEVFPNPFETSINVRWVNEYTGNASILIYSLDGRLISSKKIVKSQQEYDDQIFIPATASGMYLLKVILPNGKSYTEKVVKK